MCGEGNPFGLKLKFKLDEEGVAFASFKGGVRLQGYDGILHGGVISAILDSAMTNCLFLHGVEALTGKLDIRFLKPIPCDTTISISARINVARPPLYKMESSVSYEGVQLAIAKAKFMAMQGKL